MVGKIDWESETKYLSDVFSKCRGAKDIYSRMSKEELLEMYDQIEDGLISYNLIKEKGPEYIKNMFCSKNGLVGKFLESELLTIVLDLIGKDPLYRKKPLQKYADSLWAEKLKNRDYYEEIAEIAKIKKTENRDIFYSWLFSKEQKTAM